MFASIGQSIASMGGLPLYCGIQVLGGLSEGYFKRHVTSQERHFSELIITKVLQVGLAGMYLSQFNIGTVFIGLIGITPFVLRLISDDYSSPKIEAIVTIVARILNVFLQTCAIAVLYGTAAGILAGIAFTVVQLYALKPADSCNERLEFV